MFDLLSIKKGISALADQIRGVTGEIETLKRQRDILRVAPPTKADVIQLLHQRIDQMAAEYPGQVRKSLQGYINAPSDLLIPHHNLGFLMPTVNNYSGSGVPFIGLVFEGLAFLMQDIFKERVTAAVELMDWPQNAMPMAERDKELAKLDGKIATLEKQHKQLQTAAADAGVIINF